MQFQRSSGILLHISSLPSYGGIGDLGPAAHEFVAFLAAAKQHVWQVLPLGPTGYGNSPYASSSAFAGNPYLISLEFLAEWGWIDSQRIAGLPPHGRRPVHGTPGSPAAAAMSIFKRWRTASFRCSMRPPPTFSTAVRTSLHSPSNGSNSSNSARRSPHGSTTTLSTPSSAASSRPAHGPQWPEPLRRREPDALAKVRAEHAPAPSPMEQVLQFAFSLQWNHLREAAARSAIRILGDVAIFVNMDSADVWVHPELFELDSRASAHPRRRRPARLLLRHRPALG